MSSPAFKPTPYPHVNDVLEMLLTDVRAVLHDYFFGLYLYGSLALGDFNPNRSDIDFLVVTARELAEELLPSLEKMHARIWTSGLKYVYKLEGSYLTKNNIRRYRLDDKEHPQFNEGKFFLARHDGVWVINRHVLREHGVVIFGPPPKTLIDPVAPARLQKATLDDLLTWWAPMIKNTERLLSGPGYPAYAVHTMCRILYTLKYGTIVSKPAAGKWALKELDRRWANLIESALAWEDGQISVDVNETQKFIRYTLKQASLYRIR